MIGQRHWIFFLFLIPVLLWLFLLIVFPHIDLLLMSLRYTTNDGAMAWGAQNYMTFFADSSYWLTFLGTLFYASLATVLTILISFPIAFFIAKVVPIQHKSRLTWLLLFPLWVGELVRVYGWMMLLQENGLISHVLMGLGILNAPVDMLYNQVVNMIGVIYTSGLVMVAFLVFHLNRLDDHLMEAAYDLGSDHRTVLFEIVFPHIKPGLVFGGILIFILALGNYLAPKLLGGETAVWFTEPLYSQFMTASNWNQGAAFGVLLLILSSLLIWGGLTLSKQSLSKGGQ